MIGSWNPLRYPTPPPKTFFNTENIYSLLHHSPHNYYLALLVLQSILEG